MTGPGFTHDSPSPTDAEWFGHPVWDQVPSLPITSLPLPGSRQVVVLAAHPDDETIGVGGTVAALATTGARLLMVLATDGEHSNPDSAVWTPQALAPVRRREWQQAVGELAPGAAMLALGLPDGGLAECEDQLVELLAAHVEPGALLLATSPDDGHPDHESLGRAAARLAQQAGGECWHYPVWWWHWNRPEHAAGDLRERGLLLEPGAAAVHAKHRALDCYPSQHTGLGPGEEHGPVVPAPVQARARRSVELVFTDHRPPVAPATPPRDTFDDMYVDGDDPWGWEGSWYEERRRALVMAALLRPRYRRALELGCATGLLTGQLQPRCDELVAVDVSGRALEIARRRGLPGVAWHRAELPDGLPEGLFDLVVLSEVAYFLAPSRLLALLRGIRSQLDPDGELLLANWQHPTTGIPLDGPLVHELVEQSLGLPSRVLLADEDVRVQVFSRRDSVARAQGLV